MHYSIFKVPPCMKDVTAPKADNSQIWSLPCTWAAPKLRDAISVGILI